MFYSEKHFSTKNQHFVKICPKHSTLHFTYFGPALCDHRDQMSKGALEAGEESSSKWQRVCGYHPVQQSLPACLKPQIYGHGRMLLIGIVPSNLLYIWFTKSQNLNFPRLVLQLFLPNPLRPGVKSIMKMLLEQRRQAMRQLHLSDQL